LEQGYDDDDDDDEDDDDVGVTAAVADDGATVTDSGCTAHVGEIQKESSDCATTQRSCEHGQL